MLAVEDLEAEAVEGEGLAGAGDRLGLVDDEAGDGVGLLVGERPVEGAVEVADGDAALDLDRAVGLAGDAGGLLDVVLVGDVADDLLDDVLERDEALERAVLVDDEGEVGAAAEELAELVVEGRRLGDEVGLHRHVDDVEALEHGRARAVLADEAVDGAGEVLGVDDADDVLGLAAEDRDAGVRRVDRLLEDLGRRRLGVDHLDVAAVHHDLLDLAVAEVEALEAAVEVALLAGLAVGGASPPSSGVAARGRARAEAAGEGAAGVGGGAEEAEGEGGGSGAAGCRGLGVRGGEALGEENGGDEEGGGRGDAGGEHGPGAEEVGERPGREGDRAGTGGDAAEEKCGAEAVAVLDQAVGALGGGVAALAEGVEPRPAGGGEGAADGGEEGREQEQPQTPPPAAQRAREGVASVGAGMAVLWRSRIR